MPLTEYGKAVADGTAKLPDPPADPMGLDLYDSFEIARNIGVSLVDAIRIGGSIESAMMNAGYQPIGVVGVVEPFKPRHHESARSILPGAPVRVTRVGWAMPYGKGCHVLDKAVVVPV